MRKTMAVIVLLTLCGMPAAAQTQRSRWYVGTTSGAARLMTDEVNAGTLASLGALGGVRLTDRLSVEAELGRGVGELTREWVGWRVSFAGPNASRDEIERLGLIERVRSRSRQTANGSAMIVWRDPRPARVTAALFVGATWTRYEHRETSEILEIPAGVDPDRVARSFRPVESYSRTLGGLTAGVLVPIALTRDFSLGPEVSYTHGDVGDQHYHVLSGRARFLWRF